MSNLNISPITGELQAIFAILPDERIIMTLQAYRWTGRQGHSLKALWHGYIASFVLNLPHTNALIRRLQDDIALRQVCGFTDYIPLPSRWTFNRFISRLALHMDLVQECLNSITNSLKDLLPDFGEMVSVDSSTVHTHSNPNKKNISDPEASWTAKTNTKGKTEWYFGYKLHLAVDAKWELPITGVVSTASHHDSRYLLPLMAKAQADLDWFDPKYVMADKGYDSTAIFKALVTEYNTVPIIQIRKRQKGSVPDIFDENGVPYCQGGKPMTLTKLGADGATYQCPVGGCHLKDKKGVHYCSDEEIVKPEDDYRLFCAVPRASKEWKELYHKRVSSERVFSRLKETRRLNKHCVRGLAKITLHCLMSVLSIQANALVMARAGEIERVRECTRKVA